MMSDLFFTKPEYFYLLFLLLPLIAWYIWKEHDQHASIKISSVSVFSKIPRSYKVYLKHGLFVIRLFIIILLICILARPQSSKSWKNKMSKGIDISLAIDISSSMLARDFDPNRLQAAKNIATEFISGRPNDRIGLTVFSGESFTQCPLTTDHRVLINLFNDIESGMLKDGTAIGEGLATAINRLRDSETKSKVIILLTDGVNNSGSIAPLTAAEIAQTYDIRAYTIGVGSQGKAPYPVQTPFGKQLRRMKVEIDEQVLQEIAQMTGGKYFRATDNEKLRKIYEEINKMEQSKIKEKKYSKRFEKYLPFALIAGLLLILELLFRMFLLRKIP